MKKQKGFTLIELLVVIAIIGLLSTLAVVALNNARMKARDSKRVSDIKQIQTALELYYNDASGYPANINEPISYGGVSYMPVTPTNPQPVDTGCTGSVYTYTQTGSPIGSSYTLQFCLGGTTGGLDAGVRKATPAGIQ